MSQIYLYLLAAFLVTPLALSVPLRDINTIEEQYDSVDIASSVGGSTGAIVWQGLVSGLIGLSVLVALCFLTMLLSLALHFYHKSQLTQQGYAPLPSVIVTVSPPRLEENQDDDVETDSEDIPDYGVHGDYRLTDQAVRSVSEWLYSKNPRRSLGGSNLILVRESDGSLNIPQDDVLRRLGNLVEDELPTYSALKETPADRDVLPEYEEAI
ncbi:hypothetical protein K7432_013532 [Basidiobolus ranarum]|uniref:Uncharacterized protein n=1 Tax=Basidiobolus ranarum TaxID=34480 RepID=A0ABR2WJ61_9FUNG